MRAFTTYVWPILEYACEVANPYLARDVETLERVQRDYTWRVALRAGIVYIRVKGKRVAIPWDELRLFSGLVLVCLAMAGSSCP